MVWVGATGGTSPLRHCTIVRPSLLRLVPDALDGRSMQRTETPAACCIIPFRKSKAPHAHHHHQTG